MFYMEELKRRPVMHILGSIYAVLIRCRVAVNANVEYEKTVQQCGSVHEYRERYLHQGEVQGRLF
jgi:hypothetical protein